MGYLQVDFAEELRVSVPTLHKYETGEILPPVDLFDRIERLIHRMNEGTWRNNERMLVQERESFRILRTGQDVHLDECPGFPRGLGRAIGTDNWVAVSLAVGKRLPPELSHRWKGNHATRWVIDILENVVQTVPHTVMRAIARELECEFTYSAGAWSFRACSASDSGYWIEETNERE